jgi:hypothetical protein
MNVRASIKELSIVRLSNNEEQKQSVDYIFHFKRLVEELIVRGFNVTKLPQNLVFKNCILSIYCIL